MDWFQETFRKADAPEGMGIPELVTAVKLLGAEAIGVDEDDWNPTEAAGGGAGHAWVTQGKARLWYKDGDDAYVHLLLPGKACALVGEERLLTLLKASARYKATATRIDLALDDYDRVRGVFEVWSDIDGDTAVSRMEEWMLIATGKKGSATLGKGTPEEVIRGWQAAVASATIYFGASASSQRLRVYDKNLESDGEINAIRWEAQLRDEPALTMVKRLLAAEGEWGPAMRTRFVSLVDFREAEGSNVSRRVRVPWYAQIMQGVERASCYLPEELRQFADLYEYYRSTHAQNIAVIWHKLKDAGIEDLTTEGKRRWRPNHRRLAAE